MEFNRRFVLLLVTGIAVSFILFGVSLSGKFTLDDHSVIERRTELRELKNLPEIWVSPWHPGGQWAGNYRPLTLVSFVLNFQFSESPIGFRIINVLLYALNAVMVFYVVRKFASERAAYLTAALFLFLPIHTEAVASVVGRVYLLGALFALLSLAYLFDKKYLLSSLFFYLALFSGDFFISLLPAIGLLLIFNTGKFWQAVKLGSSYVVLLPVYFLFRYLALGKYAFGGYGFINPIIGPLAFVSVKERVFTALVHLYLYLRKMVWPVDLSPDYSFNQVPIVSNILLSWRSLAGLAFLALLAYIFYRSKRKDVRFAIILFAAPYLVISNIFFITTGTMAERYWYFPSFGLVTLSAIGLESIIVRKRKWQVWIYGALAIVMVWFSTITIRQNKVWLGDKNLFTYAAAGSPNSVWARTNLAEGYFASGDIEMAKEELEAALKISDKYSLTLFVLGKINWKEEKYSEAEEAFKRALDFDAHGRNKRSIYRTLVLVNLDTGNNKQALSYMEEAIKWPPAGELENILKVDEMLLKKVKEYSDKDLRSYSDEEIQELGQMIKILRGF
ncbi:MAG: hypothetical protein A3J47_04220 [Candidatus Yanofskybacteria bacterium RIFCSPHIGHO2_02_FULL_43_22]|uniref:Uncharacterized protein n=1 Tax=Candidatus Yanofskybacteria bacterium RIFCSPHIGHO2_02_FULL_43_22 TaxID=1802681 RepID=A0A1F8FKL6_9BACT|nr:MAG: hypothetical protein A3J47_04220 [Candidatus Yanofskybacteria bacterium RIFCSPHIGHO2_02_FULL_43_22]